MAIVGMNRDKFKRTGDAGAIYITELELVAGESDTYLLPVGAIYAIGCQQENGVLYFTIDSEDTIVAGDEEWSAWNGTSGINQAVTAFKFVWGSATAKAVVTVKAGKV